MIGYVLYGGRIVLQHESDCEVWLGFYFEPDRLLYVWGRVPRNKVPVPYVRIHHLLVDPRAVESDLQVAFQRALGEGSAKIRLPFRPWTAEKKLPGCSVVWNDRWLERE